MSKNSGAVGCCRNPAATQADSRTSPTSLHATKPTDTTRCTHADNHIDRRTPNEQQTDAGLIQSNIQRQDHKARDGSYLLTVKVKKLIFSKWSILTGLDTNVDVNCTEKIYVVSLRTGKSDKKLKWLHETVEYDKWAAEIGTIYDYSEHTTITSTDRAAEPWLSMRNARILAEGDDSTGWSAGNMALNLLTRLEMRHDKKWINFDSLVNPHLQADAVGLPTEIVNTVFRLHLMATDGNELSTTRPTFTTHHPNSIANDTHSVESQESLALELCVQVAYDAATDLRRFRICDQHRVETSILDQQPILDVYCYFDDIHRPLP